MRQLYNEGRVVGYSAYEMYVRHHLGIDPDHTVASEKEWLASMMAMGSSMLLRVGTDSTAGTHFIDVPFPEGSRLCAANNIIASFFSGKGDVNAASTGAEDGTTTGWVHKVTDYGPLIENNTQHPNGEVSKPDKGSIPADKSVDFDDTCLAQMKEYMKIVDGIVIQPGTWTANASPLPQEDFKPNLAAVPTVRISFSDKIETPFYLLLTGFTNRTVVDGQTGFDSALHTLSPDDGDFLGPWAFPWSAKIFFYVPTSFVNYFLKNNYSRKLPVSGEAKAVRSDAIIDMATTNPAEYYTSTDNGLGEPPATVEVEVTQLHTLGPDAAVLATYRDYSGQKENSNGHKLPPALYGAVIKETDAKKKDSAKVTYNPIDAIAPGTVKLYHMRETDPAKVQEMVAYLETTTPYNYGFYRDRDSYVIYEYDSQLAAKNTTDTEDIYVPLSDDRTVNINGLQTYNTKYAWLFVHSSSYYYTFTVQGNPTNPESCAGCTHYVENKCDRDGYRKGGKCLCLVGPGGAPAKFEIEKVKSFIVGEVKTGQFSDDFIKKYGVDGSNAIGCIDSDKITSESNHPNTQIYGNFWGSIPENEQSNYCVFFTGPEHYNYDNADDKARTMQISYIVVRKKDGMVSDLGWAYHDLHCGGHSVSDGINFANGMTSTNNAQPGGSGTEESPYAESYVKQDESADIYPYKKPLTRYLGNWWNNRCTEPCVDDANCPWKESGCCCMRDYCGKIVYRGHRPISEVVPFYNSFYFKDAALPDFTGDSVGDTPSNTKGDYLDWLYEEATLLDLLKESGQNKNITDASNIPSDSLTDDCLVLSEDLKIHKSYLGMSLGDFLQNAAHKNLDQPADDADNNYSTNESETLYVYTIETMKAFCANTCRNIQASAKVIIPGTAKNFFDSRMWRIEERSVTNNGSGSPTEWGDATERANRKDASIYAAVGTSGHHVAKSVSVLDDDGAMLQFAGTGAVISTDVITWSELLDALNHNKSVDLLGEVLLGLKNHLSGSGVNYLEFKGSGENGDNKLRVYFSKTAPESQNGDPIPDGSIGIGWEEENGDNA